MSTLTDVRCANDIEALIAEAKAGSKEALGELLERYRGLVTSICEYGMFERIRRRTCPEDVVQETMLDMIDDFHLFEGTTADEFGGWICFAARNTLSSTVHHHMKTGKRSMEVELATVHITTADNTVDLLDTIEGAPANAHESVTRADDMAAVHRAIAELPGLQAVAVRHHFLDSMTIGEVAEAMDLQYDAAASLIRRGIILLRERMSWAA